MSKSIKITIAVVVIVFVAAVAGIMLMNRLPKGASPTVSQAPSASQAQPSSANQNQSTPSDMENGQLPQPPKPTGNVDDTVNAIEQGASVENTQATGDENDARSAAGETQTNDLSNLGNAN